MLIFEPLLTIPNASRADQVILRNNRIHALYKPNRAGFTRIKYVWNHAGK